MEKATVETKSLAYREMESHWQLVDDLKGGTDAMRRAGERWLPREEKEADKDYQRRLAHSFLYGAYSDTLDGLASRPFSKPVQLDDAPDQFVDWVDNVDGMGGDLTQFGKDLFRSAVDYGLCHALVDFPPTSDVQSLADAESIRLRPTFALISPQNLLGWRTTELPNGAVVLDRIRILETAVEPDGEWGERIVRRVRVYSRESIDVWEEVESEGGAGEIEVQPDEYVTPLASSTAGKEWVPVSTTANTLGKVPLVTVYFKRTGFMTGTPVLEDLAWLNVEHWQSSSQQRNYLRFARCGMWTLFGFDEEDAASVVLAPNRKISTSAGPNDAAVQVTETTGAAAKVGAEDLAKIEQRMEILGLQPLISRSGDVTATGAALDEGRTQTDVQAWIHATEAALRKCFAIAAEWMGIELPESFAVDINDDFVLSARAQKHAELIVRLVEMNKLTLSTGLSELRRYSVLTESLDPDQEADRVESAGPPAGMLPIPSDPTVTDDGE